MLQHPTETAAVSRVSIAHNWAANQHRRPVVVQGQAHFPSSMWTNMLVWWIAFSSSFSFAQLFVFFGGRGGYYLYRCRKAAVRLSFYSSEGGRGYWGSWLLCVCRALRVEGKKRYAAAITNELIRLPANKSNGSFTGFYFYWGGGERGCYLPCHSLDIWEFLFLSHSPKYTHTHSLTWANT